MLILLNNFVVFLFFNCLIVCCLYFWKETPFKQAENKLIYLKALKLTKYVKTAKDNRIASFVHQSQELPVSNLSD